MFASCRNPGKTKSISKLIGLACADAWRSIPGKVGLVNFEDHGSIEQRNFLFERRNSAQGTAFRPLGVLFLLLFLAQLFLLPLFKGLRSTTGHNVLLSIEFAGLSPCNCFSFRCWRQECWQRPQAKPI